MELTQLRYLVTIADEGGFTPAARKLRLSQPSLSLAVKKLEDEVGQPLFDRLTRKVVPTEAGERIIEIARRVLNDIEHTVNEVRDLKGEVSGTLRIGAIPTIGPFVLPGILEPFSHKYPNVDLHITEDVTGRILALLEQGALDVALLSTVPERPGIHTEQVGTEALVAIVSHNHHLADQEELEWSQLENERFLVLGEEHCLAEQTAWFCRKNRVSGRTMLEGAQLATIAALVESGLGISLVPALMAKTRATRSCSFIPIADAPPSRPLFIAWSILRYRSQAAREFTRIANQVISQLLNTSIPSEVQSTIRA